MSENFNKLIGFWNAIVVVVTLFAALTIPLKIVFEYESIDDAILDNLIAVVFILDFVINLVRKKKALRNQEYFNKPWLLKILFLTDLLAAIPFALFISNPVFQFIRLLKLVRVYEIMQSIKHSLINYANVFIFFVFVFWSVIVLHWITCGWYSLGEHNPEIDFASNYINSLYWTTTTITTVGYGDIIPTTNAQKIYSIFVQIMGFGVFGFIIGSVASRLIRRDPAKKRYQESMENLTSLMHYRTLPPNLKSRIVAFYRYMWKKRLGYDETAFLKSLPQNLQTEVALHLKRDVIGKVSIFKNASMELKKEIALLLRPVFLTPEDYLFKAGDVGNEMFFVINGEVEVLTQKEDRLLSKMGPGDFFGEIALFKNESRTATIKALSYCDIYALDKKSFDKVISKYPDIATKIKEKVEVRENKYSSN